MFLLSLYFLPLLSLPPSLSFIYLAHHCVVFGEGKGEIERERELEREIGGKGSYMFSDQEGGGGLRQIFTGLIFISLAHVVVSMYVCMCVYGC